MDGTSKALKTKLRAGIVGAAIVPHAPQLLSLPETEDLDQAGRVRTLMKTVGDGLRALEPDLVIIVSNCHGEDMIVDCVPAFAIHCGDRGAGSGKHKGMWRVDGDMGNALTRYLMEEGFDPAFTLATDLGTAFTIPHEYCGFGREQPFVAIFVNVYVPPQPSPERCFAFGKALNRSLERMGKRAVIIISGGLSHYPGTPMYPTPDLATDTVIFERLKAGNLNYIMSFDSDELDRSGNVECRTLQLLAGCIGDRKPDHAAFEPSWHHIYAILGWTRPIEPSTYVPLYTGFVARHSQLALAINAIVTDDSAKARYMADRAAYAASFDLAPEEASAIAELDEDVLRERFSINAMLTYQAKIRVGSPLKHRDRIK